MTLILFILILSVLVFVHEFGHFLAAKKAGILVEEFGFGLPPRIWGKKIGETIYSINALPIGGFVKLYGEEGPPSPRQDGASEGQGGAYFEKSIPRRLSVLLAGVMMNLLLAIVSFSILYFVSGIPTKTGKIMIVDVAKDSPAESAGLKADDQIIAVDGQKLSSLDQFVQVAKEKGGEKIELEIFREKDNPCRVLGGMAVGSGGQGGLGGQGKITYQCEDGNIILAVLSRQNPPEGEGPLGVAVSDVELKKYPWWQMPFLGVKEGFKDSLAWGGMIVGALKKTLVSLITVGQVPKDIAGPVGIFQITSQVAKEGFLAVLQFLGILSVNLAIINILPFPALDGGRLIFLAYEAAFRKKVSAKIEILVHQAGMAILLALMVLITINDIIRLVKR